MNYITPRWLLLLFFFMNTGCAQQTQNSSVGGLALHKRVDFLPTLVVSISEEYANINTNISQAILANNGITNQSVFTAHFRGKTLRALLGKDYTDVPRGDWIALIEEGGYLQLAISFGNAATILGCAVGDTLYIEPLTILDPR